MIKLIATDLDGTLLPEGTTDINPKTFDIIRRLRDKGILVVAASGRQFPAMLHVMQPVKDDIVFIADNGGYISENGADLEINSIEPEMVTQVCEFLNEQPELQYMLSTNRGTFASKIDDDLFDLMKNGYGCDMYKVENAASVSSPVTKISAYSKGAPAKDLVGPIAERFGDELYVVVSGERWIDFIEKGVNKGSALQQIQRLYGVTPEETMAFGDNDNDIPMLECAKFSYAAPEAKEGARAAASEVLTGDTWDSVINKIEEMVL